METEKKKISPEELEEQIRAGKEEIQRIKDRMERPGKQLRPTVTREDLKALRIAREQLAQAKEALLAAGGNYPADEADRRAAELLDNLPCFAKLTFEIGGYFGGYQTHTIERIENGRPGERPVIKYDRQGTSICPPAPPAEDELSLPDGIDSAEKVIDHLKELHVEEWMPEYWPDRFGVVVCDGTQWSLKIEFSNGHPAWEVYGSNSYPYNFDAFRRRFGFSGKHTRKKGSTDR